MRVRPLPARRLASRHASPRSPDHHSSSSSSFSDSSPVHSLEVAAADQAGTGVDVGLGISDGDVVGDRVGIDHRDATDDTEEYDRRRDAWNSGNKDGSRTGQKEDSKALVTVDGEGVDWSHHSEDEDYALMACNSLDSETEVFSCSNKCKESYANLKKLYDAQREQLNDASIEIKAYSQGLKKVEAQLVAHQQGQLWYEQKIKFMKIDLDDKIDVLTYHKKLLAEAQKQKEDGIFISQDKYVAEILRKFDFANVKTASTPIETLKPLVKDVEASDVDVHLYRSMIGSLMYVTASRPDIMFAVYACSRFQVTPKTSHLSAVKRIFRYLKGKPKLGLWYPRESSFDLESYSDSDYAGANLDRKSTTGGCQFLGRRLITWQCKKQTIVATSTTEAEYVAAASCCGQVLWIQNQMLDYGFNFMNTKIYIDNESTICIVKNPVYHSKTKHIAIRHHFIRDAYEKKLIQVLKIHTNDNVADLLTKAFDVSRFQFLVVSIGMINP
ncbi:hypothetical protein Tco_1308160 [Tanacetum coccineum]